MAYQRTHDVFGSRFCGMEMAQYWADLPLWENFLNEHSDVAALIEMGTYKTGMSVFLKVQCMARKMRFWTFDRRRPTEMDSPICQALALREDFVLGDFLGERKDKLIGLLAWEEIKPLLLYVDGGNKPLEFATFVPYLAPGDYVAVHDYGTEFKPGAEEPVEGLIVREYWQECEVPPQPCLTRFWRRR
jgi:hypothetical protein